MNNRIVTLDHSDRAYVKSCVREFIAYARRRHAEAPQAFIEDTSVRLSVGEAPEPHAEVVRPQVTKAPAAPAKGKAWRTPHAPRQKQDPTQRFTGWLAANQPATLLQMTIGLRISKRQVERQLAPLMKSGAVHVAKKEQLGNNCKPTNFYAVTERGQL